MTDEQKASFSTKRPLTKEEYEARQSVIRRVVDPETGRTRCVIFSSTTNYLDMKKSLLRKEGSNIHLFTKPRDNRLKCVLLYS